MSPDGVRTARPLSARGGVEGAGYCIYKQYLLIDSINGMVFIANLVQ